VAGVGDAGFDSGVWSCELESISAHHRLDVTDPCRIVMYKHHEQRYPPFH
jgi:hypothetical protein